MTCPRRAPIIEDNKMVRNSGSVKATSIFSRLQKRSKIHPPATKTMTKARPYQRKWKFPIEKITGSKSQST